MTRRSVTKGKGINEESINEEQKTPAPPSAGSVAFNHGTIFPPNEASPDYPPLDL
jgi:hypothetical protein